jgi:predicted DNA-binding transcriptional regulator AlpA
MTKQFRQLIDEGRVAAMVGVNRTTIAKWRRDGCMPDHYRLGIPGKERIRYDPDAIDKWLNGNKVMPDSGQYLLAGQARQSSS